jgi:hypothetical protein
LTAGPRQGLQSRSWAPKALLQHTEECVKRILHFVEGLSCQSGRSASKLIAPEIEG